jgi:hypothetical protein
MSDPNPAGAEDSASSATGETPAEKLAAAMGGRAKAAAPKPKPNTFKVSSKHDWCVCTATSEGEARQKWHEFFGIKGSDHEVEVVATSEKSGTHSGQKTASVLILTGEPAKV